MGCWGLLIPENSLRLAQVSHGKMKIIPPFFPCFIFHHFLKINENNDVYWRFIWQQGTWCPRCISAWTSDLGKLQRTTTWGDLTLKETTPKWVYCVFFLRVRIICPEWKESTRWSSNMGNGIISKYSGIFHFHSFLDPYTQVYLYNWYVNQSINDWIMLDT